MAGALGTALLGALARFLTYKERSPEGLLSGLLVLTGLMLFAVR